jgi:hypothetical integral membrane protein (TIGR02206 family)
VPLFSAPHVAALLALAVACGFSVWLPRRHPGGAVAAWSWLVAGVILAGWLGEYADEIATGRWTVEYNLPLQLTDAVSAVAVLALLIRAPLLVELTYFWSFTATLQAVVTPDLSHDFPNFYYFAYFAYHEGAIVAGCLLVFGCRRYPRPGAVRRVALLTVAFAAVSGAGDVVTGGNYMYLRTKPVHGSLLSVMGPWPWYLATTAALSVALLALVGYAAALVRRLDGSGS